MKRAIALGVLSIGLVAAESLFSPTYAAQSLSCTGEMNNGWEYTATFLDGRFTQIRWERAGQPPQTTDLTFDAVNASGQPVYRGSFLAATTVTVIDLSEGNVRDGSEISVNVEEWGWSRGLCSASTSSNTTTSPNTVAAVRQNLLGIETDQAREWLRQNSFFFVNTAEHTSDRVIEQWNRDTDSVMIYVVIENGIITDVTTSPER